MKDLEMRVKHLKIFGPVDFSGFNSRESRSNHTKGTKLTGLVVAIEVLKSV